MKSLLQAAGVAIAVTMIGIQLYHWGIWPDVPWSFVVVPALVGSAFLALRHPGHRLLTAFLFFPLLVLLVFYVGACFPLGPSR